MNLVAPTAFKGTMTPLEVARHLAEPGDRLLPLSEGGDGFLECLQHGLGGVLDCGSRRLTPAARSPRPDPAAARRGRRRGVREGDWVWPTSTDRPAGGVQPRVGELLGGFNDQPRIWVGLGGSATVDGGRDWPALGCRRRKCL